jgi:hypothetical protein
MTLNQLEDRNLLSAILSTGGNVTIYESGDVSQIYSFRPFEEGFAYNVNSVFVDGLYAAVAPENSGGPRVQVYTKTANSYEKIQDFFAFEPEFRGGISLAFANLNDDNKIDLVVAAGQGGGPRVQFYLNTPEGFVKHDDFFSFNEEDRTGLHVSGCSNTFILGPITGSRLQVWTNGSKVAEGNIQSYTSFAFGSVLNQENRIYAASPITLSTYSISLEVINQTALFEPFESISMGGYTQFNSIELMASHKDGSFIELDDQFGIPLSWDTFKRSYNNLHTLIGDTQFPITTGFVLPPTEFEALASFRDAVPNGYSIGSSEGTGTYTMTVDFHGTPVGLTNRHVVENRTFDTVIGSPMFSPGPIDTDQALQQIGTVLAKSDVEKYSVDSALISLSIPPVPNTLKIIYFNPYTDEFETLKKTIKYDSNIVAEPNDLLYKEGRTTGHTRGTVYSNDYAVSVIYPDKIRDLDHQIIIIGDQFALPGDSGSLVFKVIDGQAYWVAQLFAGSYHYGIVTPTNMILPTMDVTFNEFP